MANLFNSLIAKLQTALNGPANQPVVFGVCVTLAKRLDIEPWLVRLIAIFLGVFFSIATLIIYLSLAFLLEETNGRVQSCCSNTGAWLRDKFRALGTGSNQP